jgi:hypothetical protein
MDWGSFWTGVAATVIGSLIVAAIIGGVRWYNRRRREKGEEAEVAHLRRMPVRVGGHIVAGELRLNAELAKRCEEGSHVPSEARNLEVTEWRGRRGEMMPLRDEDPELWTALEETYAALDQSKRDGGYPPTEASLLELADRLDEAAGD